MIAGQENGQIPFGARRIRPGQHSRSRSRTAARRAGCCGVRQSIRGPRVRGAHGSPRPAEGAGLRARRRCAESSGSWTGSALEKRAVGFRSLTEAIDTTTPGGRLVFHLFGALGQFERDLIRERTRAGLAAAEARGRKGGRKPVITAEKLKRAREIVDKGLTVREAAIRLKVGKTALYDALRQ